MSEDETFTLCPGCGQRVDRDEPGVRYGVEQKRTATMGGTFNIDGMGGFFHPGCSMQAVGYVERDVPNSGS
jgi:hypothetical protein